MPLAVNLTLKEQEKYLKKMNWILFIVLFLMIAGFFSWSENVTITRIIKVISRIGMTLASYLIFRNIKKKSSINLFEWKNSLSPIMYVGYLTLGLVSFLWSTNIGYSALQWVMDIEGLVFAFFYIKSILLLEYNFPDNKITFYNLLGNSIFVIIAIFLIGSIVSPDDYYRAVEGGESHRLGGWIMNPNELGMVCGLAISCLIFDIYRKHRIVWSYTKILALLAGLLMTGSRSSLIGLLLIVFFHIRQAGNKKLEIATYIAVVAALPILVQKMILRKGGIDDVLSMTGRLPFWKALISEGLPREPLFGFGFMRIDYKEDFSSVHTYTAHMTHNTFIQVLMNLGFVGFTLVLFQMFFTIRGILSEEKQKKLMLVGILIPVIINSFTEFGIFGETNYGILFYQFIILYISITLSSKNSNTNSFAS